MPEAPFNRNYEKGVLGEAAAEEFLSQQGMRCIDRRYHSPYGEIDLILLDGEILIFAEVKARQRGTLQAAQSAVTPAKQKRIIQTALCYLNEHPEHANRLMRFDVLALAGDCISHLPDAFQGSGW